MSDQPVSDRPVSDQPVSDQPVSDQPVSDRRKRDRPAKGWDRLRTEFEHAEESTGLRLWQVTNRWQSAQRAALLPFGLTHVQFVVTASLTWLGTGGPVNQRQLADFAGIDPMMTSQVVRMLEMRGLVTRSPHPEDGRARALEVTRRGRELVNRAIVAVEACDDAFFAPLATSRTRFTRMLGKLEHRGT